MELLRCEYYSNASPIRLTARARLVSILRVFVWDEEQTWNKSLLQAAKSGSIAEAQRALNNGANINCHDNESDRPTALHIATQTGNIDMTRFLLDAGARPNQQDRCGTYAIDNAIAKNNTALVELLRQKGATKESQYWN